MSISFLNTILDELKEEMEDKIQATGEYETSPTVKRGIATWGETEGKRPYVWFIPSETEIEELMGDTANVTISVDLYGYADTDGYGNADRTHNLLKDVMYFLWNDYTRQTVILGSMMDEGGMGEELGQSVFILSFTVFCNISTTTIQIVE